MNNYDEKKKELIREFFINNPGRVIRSTELAECLDIHESHQTAAATRKLIKQVIIETQLPIGSCRSGYFLIGSVDELAGYLEELEQRCRAIRLRGDKVLRNFLGTLPLTNPV